MTTTYYECIKLDDGQPATKRQLRLYGTAGYGYKSRVAAELNCPVGCVVRERHSDGADDWSGRIVSIRLSTGELHRHDHEYN